MTVTIDDITHIATLARLSLSPEEKVQYAQELSVVLDYIGMLDDVDTEGVEETCQVTGLQDIVREDVVVDSSEEERAALIAAFPDRVGALLKVKAVFDTDGDI
ncbi:MAG: Asp-tRNA(Asn)/Glu-tRNA(Gln) amidotransferase subunit GatC [Candidatus Magasanikbacteria bacterium]|nr:Asp-tRNA(Asn)/Glu-tRNA(Gln) amidotransferase subunit GatC [Candidatus Magasanikbacteria bacterium]